MYTLLQCGGDILPCTEPQEKKNTAANTSEGTEELDNHLKTPAENMFSILKR